MRARRSDDNSSWVDRALSGSRDALSRRGVFVGPDNRRVDLGAPGQTERRSETCRSCQPGTQDVRGCGEGKARTPADDRKDAGNVRAVSGQDRGLTVATVSDFFTNKPVKKQHKKCDQLEQGRKEFAKALAENALALESLASRIDKLAGNGND